MSFVDWMFNNLPNDDVIDLYFILSDMKDITLTPAEIAEGAGYDSAAGNSVSANQVPGDQSGVPMGKRVY